MRTITHAFKQGLTGAAALLLALCIYGCKKKEISLPPIGGKGKIVMLGELVAGDTMNIRAGQSVPVSSSQNMSFQLPEGLGITCRDRNNTTFPFNAYSDHYSFSLYTLLFSNERTVEAGQTYQLTAQHGSLGTATCNIEVPAAFSAAVSDTGSITYNGRPYAWFDVTLEDPAGAEQYYALEAVEQLTALDAYFTFNGRRYSLNTERLLLDSLIQAGLRPEIIYDTVLQRSFIRIPVTTEDPRSENMENGAGPFLPYKRVLFTDRGFNGSSFRTRLYLDISAYKKQESKGALVVNVKSVAKDYFRFLSAYDQYIPERGLSTFSQPLSIPGNVQNGIGMVGGVYLHSFKYRPK